MPPPKSSKLSHQQFGKGIRPASRTTFLSVKKFRFSRVQKGALIAGTILFIGALVWCALYFFL